jgi:hypothetical protein
MPIITTYTTSSGYLIQVVLMVQLLQYILIGPSGPMLDASLATHPGTIQGGSLRDEQCTVVRSMARSLHCISAQAWGLDPGQVITIILKKIFEEHPRVGLTVICWYSRH